MFDLNEAIAAWRRALEAGEACTAADLAELESHLREQTAQLRAAGLSQEEAFAVACRRLGHPAALCEEFVKDDPAARWRSRLLWMLVGALAFTLYGSLGEMFEMCVRAVAILIKAGPDTCVVVGLLTHLSVTVGLGLWALRLYRCGLSERWSRWQNRLLGSTGRVALLLLALLVPIAARLMLWQAWGVYYHSFSTHQISKMVMYMSGYYVLLSLVLPVVMAIAIMRIYRRRSAIK